jgi:hypothetical protein
MDIEENSTPELFFTLSYLWLLQRLFCFVLYPCLTARVQKAVCLVLNLLFGGTTICILIAEYLVRTSLSVTVTVLQPLLT